MNQINPAGTNIDAGFDGFRRLASNPIHCIDFFSSWNGAPLTQFGTSCL
jgi:hypothetical protein